MLFIDQQYAFVPATQFIVLWLTKKAMYGDILEPQDFYSNIKKKMLFLFSLFLMFFYEVYCTSGSV